MIFAENTAGAFQHNELNVGVGVILQHHGGAGDGGSDRGSINLGAARVLGHAQEHGAAA